MFRSFYVEVKFEKDLQRIFPAAATGGCGGGFKSASCFLPWLFLMIA